MQCPHCGGNHPRTAEFCPNTGKAIPKSPKNILPILLISVSLCVGIVLLAIGAWWYFKDDFSFDLLSFISSDPTEEERSEEIDPSDTPEPSTTPTLTSTIVPSETPTLTPTITFTPTVTFTPVPTSTPTYFSINPMDNALIVFVDEGNFIMGVDPGGTTPEENPNFSGPEYPEKVVYVDSFWIYQTEVTNAMYRACVEANFCDEPISPGSYLSNSYFEDDKYDDYPVVNVEWRQAATYCDWSGGRLPTEAEWEKAARGPDGNKYPWGNSDPADYQTNLCDSNCTFFTNSTFIMDWIDDGHDGPAPVGTYPLGKSYYGVLDLSGNVWEWVFDWFQVSYSRLPLDNPNGPASGSRKVIRGGSFINNIEDVRALTRESWDPQNATTAIGFRCVIEDLP